VPSQIGARTKVGEFLVSLVIRTGRQGPQVTELHIEHPEAALGAPVTQSVLRQIAIDKIVREAVAKVRRPATVVNQEHGTFSIPGEEGVWGGGQIRKGRGSQTERGQLIEVADIYYRAINERRPPVKAVAEELRYSRSHAGRLVGQARKAGLLSLALPGKPSEVEAEILRQLADLSVPLEPGDWPDRTADTSGTAP